ncbi:MAG: hypothetical protein C4520_08770 [Candidatus Abyssobacteria bacterium SURF_5]|uniref:Uncharacterized protein n=1 Tax=Abyssobacteria bacterium (strain SURF_5) TaxID=2093360 RepID=A0A3A4NNH8_ABYX5|nr:MAG: hypothetical protein C4520_08770 [Candidatus Abyssubacteria bacterium SURF_5]
MRDVFAPRKSPFSRRNLTPWLILLLISAFLLGNLHLIFDHTSHKKETCPFCSFQSCSAAISPDHSDECPVAAVFYPVQTRDSVRSGFLPSEASRSPPL